MHDPDTDDLPEVGRPVEREAVRDFVRGVRSGDLELMDRGIAHLDRAPDGFGWRRAMQRIARLPDVSATTRQHFARTWYRVGDRIRELTGDEPILLDGLRHLLPSYYGKPLLLYRGEADAAQRHRRYGLYWSPSRDSAERAARRGDVRSQPGGSVLLRTFARADAIITRLRGDEPVYLIDRRRLGIVSVLERFGQVATGEPEATLRIPMARASAD